MVGGVLGQSQVFQRSGALAVGEVLIADGAVPMFLGAGILAGSGYGGHMSQLMTGRNDGAGGQLGITALTVGVAGVAGDGAGGSSLVLNDGAAHMVGGVLGQSQVLQRSGALAVGEVLIANRAVPMFLGAGIHAGGGHSGHMGHIVRFGENGAGGQLGITALAVGVAGIAGVFTGCFDGILEFRAAFVVVGVHGSDDGGQLLSCVCIRIVFAALGAGPVFNIALLAASGCNSINMGQIMSVGIFAGDLQEELTAQTVPTVTSVTGDAQGVGNNPFVGVIPSQKFVRITGHIDAGGQVAGIHHAADGVNVTAFDLAAIDGKVVGRSSGADGRRIELGNNGMILFQLGSGHIEVGIEVLAVVLIIPGDIHIVVFPVDLNKIPCMTFALARTGHHAGGDARLRKQVLERICVALAYGLAVYQGAVGVIGVRSPVYILHIVDQIVVQIELDFILAHIIGDAGQGFCGSGVKSGLGGRKLICGKDEIIVGLHSGDLATGGNSVALCQPKILGIVSEKSVPYGLEVVVANGMGIVFEGNGSLVGFDAGPQGVIRPGEVFAVFHGSEGGGAKMLSGGRGLGLQGDKRQNQNQGDHDCRQSLGLGDFHGGFSFQKYT